MARMQLQLEKQLRRKSPIADIVLACFFRLSFISQPVWRGRSIAMSVYVCVSVCPLAYLKNTYTNFAKLLLFIYYAYALLLPVAVARSSSDDSAICYVLPDLWMTSYMPVIGEAEATPVGRI